jgi:hypothetical protein
LELRKRDIDKVVAALPHYVALKLQQEPALLLAGGFIRDTLIGQPPSDIDLFGPAEKLEGAITDLSFIMGGGSVTETRYAKTFKPLEGLPIQVVLAFPVTSQVELLARFNYTVNQAVIWFDDFLYEWRGVCYAAFYADLAERRLAPNPAMTNPAQSLASVPEMVARGWKIEPEDVLHMAAYAAYAEAVEMFPLERSGLEQRLIHRGLGEDYACLSRETTAAAARSNSVQTVSFPEYLEPESWASIF